MSAVVRRSVETPRGKAHRIDNQGTEQKWHDGCDGSGSDFSGRSEAAPWQRCVDQLAHHTVLLASNCADMALNKAELSATVAM